MKLGTYEFNRLEFAGSLGDLGTLIPLCIALILICNLSITTVFLTIGAFYLLTGFYFRLPIPVQPLKVVSAVIIASPALISPSVLAASGLIFGGVMLILAITGLIDRIATLFEKPIVRGIQLGLGMILINKGLDYIALPQLLLRQVEVPRILFDIPLNPMIGVLGAFLTLVLLPNKRFPAALVIITLGIVVGVGFGSLQEISLVLGPTAMNTYIPSWNDVLTATALLVIPQIPLTIGNSVIGTTDTCYSLFGRGTATEKVSNRAFSASLGLANLFIGFLGGIPMCHGSGGLAAHYRFGARTGGSNLMIGGIFLVLALGFGTIGISLLSSIPNAILGILLLFAGLELALLVKDVSEKNDLFVVLLIAGVGFSTTNMGIAFGIGILVYYLMRWRKIFI